MQITLEPVADRTIVRLEGTLTGVEGKELERQINPVVSTSGRLVIVDLAGVDRINSEGLGSLVNLACRSNVHRCRLVFARPTLFVHEVITVTGLDRFFQISSEAPEEVAS